MSELGRFQSAFAEILTGEAAPLAPWIAAADAPRLAVYRNTVAKGCADAIAAQFPTLLAVVGEAWLRDAAVVFTRAHPPVAASLADYGEDFPDWLAGFAPAAAMPWLIGLARIDWARRDALFAEDRAPLRTEALASLGPESYTVFTAELHPATRILSFADGTAGLWLALQGENPPAEIELSPDPECLLITRPQLEVRSERLSPGGLAFLDACRGGLSLAAAGEAALAAEPDLPLADAFAGLLRAGAFSRLKPLARET
jgi:hypothetical protein